MQLSDQRRGNIKDGAPLAELLKSLTNNHLPLAYVGSIPARDFGFFHARKLSSKFTERRWFYSDAQSCMK